MALRVSLALVCVLGLLANADAGSSVYYTYSEILPLEAYLAKSDLVAVVEYTKKGPHLTVPRYGAVEVQEYTAKVVAGISKDAGKVVAAAASATQPDWVKDISQIEILWREEWLPGSGPGEPPETTQPENSPLLPLLDQIPLVAGENGTLTVIPGKEGRFIVFLKKLPGRNVFALYHTVPFTAEIGEHLRQLADVDKWPWGKVVNGLQLAVLPQPPNRSSEYGTWVRLVVVCRNVGKEPAAVGLDNSAFSISVSGVEGKPDSISGSSLSCRYSCWDNRDNGPIILPRGAIANSFSFKYPKLESAQLKITAEYTNGKEWKTDGVSSWRGTVQSAPIDYPGK